VAEQVALVWGPTGYSMNKDNWVVVPPHFLRQVLEFAAHYLIRLPPIEAKEELDKNVSDEYDDGDMPRRKLVLLAHLVLHHVHDVVLNVLGVVDLRDRHWNDPCGLDKVEYEQNLFQA